MSALSNGSPVELQFTGTRFRRPPEAALFFDLTLRNQNPLARWFLLPAVLHVIAKQAGVGVSGLEVFELPGRGRVLLGRFFGTARFQTVCLPPAATVKIRRFEISVAGEPPDQASFEVVIASRLMIGDDAAESWFGVDPMSGAQADVTRDGAKMVSSKHTPDLREIPVRTVDEQRVPLQVELTSPN